MTSFAISPFTMPAALAAADDFLGAQQQWEADPGNRVQVEWLRQFRQRAKVASGLSEIARHATERAETHVGWLKSHGWEADLKDGPPDAMFLASVLAIGGKWTRSGRKYVARKVSRASVFAVFVHDERVVRMPTQAPGVEFLVRQADGPMRDERELYEHSLALVETTPPSEVLEEGEVDFPLVDLQTKSSAEYMLGLRTRTHFIAQAAEGFELKMNHLGGVARARAELMAPRGGPPPPKPRVLITEPFVVAVIKQGLSEPVFAAYVDRDSWRDPGDEAV